MPEYEVRIKNLYDQMPTEEESVTSAIAMAKAQLSLGINPLESRKILEKLDPTSLVPDLTTFIHPMIPIIPMMIQPMVVPLEYTISNMVKEVSEPVTETLSEDILPALVETLPFREPDTTVIVKSTLKKIGRFFFHTFRTLYGVED